MKESANRQHDSVIGGSSINELSKGFLRIHALNFQIHFLPL